MEHLSHHQPLSDQAARIAPKPLSRHYRASPRVARLLAFGVALALVLPACKSKNTSTGPTAIVSRQSLVPASTAQVLDYAGSQIVGANQGQMFDDFTFTANSSIRTVAWQGAYCLPVTNSPAQTPTATAFRLSFYADAGGRPQLATPLAQVTVPIAQAAETLDRNLAGLVCIDGSGRNGTNVTYAMYRYQATLATPFAAAANTKYWFIVQAITPSFVTLWGWRDGVADNNTSLRYSNNTFIGTSTFDRAFALTP